MAAPPPPPLFSGWAGSRRRGGAGTRVRRRRRWAGSRCCRCHRRCGPHRRCRRHHERGAAERPAGRAGASRPAPPRRVHPAGRPGRFPLRRGADLRQQRADAAPQRRVPAAPGAHRRPLLPLPPGGGGGAAAAELPRRVQPGGHLPGGGVHPPAVPRHRGGLRWRPGGDGSPRIVPLAWLPAQHQTRVATDVPERGGDPGGAEPAHRRQPPAPDRGPVLRQPRRGPRGRRFPPAHRGAGPPPGPPRTWRGAGMAAPGSGRRVLLPALLLLGLAALASPPPAAAQPPPAAAQPPPAALRAGHAASSLPAAAAAPRTRYLLYDVNPPEGFNLRRDVYIRIASLLKTLLKSENWVLVLPPWGRLYHWQSPDILQVRIPWSEFFDVPSLNRNIPVIEYEQFLAESGGPFIEQIYVLQGYAEGWKEGTWEEKINERPCIDQLMYSKDKHAYYRGWFWGYEETRGLNLSCLSVQGSASIVAPILLKNTSAQSVMLDRAENLLHDHYGGKDYWNTRRSMVFAKHLRVVGDEFRNKYLQSTDEADRTHYKEDWTQMKVKTGTARGGPYLGVHLRRKDFIWGHREDVPSLQGAVKKIRSLLETHKLQKVFVATDAVEEEVELLKKLLPEMVRFEPSWEELELYKDGGLAVIDQWICAHARYFIGTSVSTFSFRIHEEREILGFDPKTTYNRFCGDKEKNCEQPTHWKILY